MLKAWRVLIIVVCLGLDETFADDLKAETRDSYLDAYHEFRPETQTNKYDRNSKYSHFYDEGPPHQFYGLPETNYGPPGPVYGPSSFPPMMSFYGMPHAMLSFLDKIKMKLNVYTILKIILKLVIFKKIVSFIALICLLLFIPKFKLSKEETDEDIARRSIPLEQSLKGQDQLTTLTERVFNALESYTKVNRSTSTDEIFQKIEDKFSFTRLLNMYGIEA